jgi:hypothetical protein
MARGCVTVVRGPDHALPYTAAPRRPGLTLLGGDLRAVPLVLPTPWGGSAGSDARVAGGGKADRVERGHCPTLGVASQRGGSVNAPEATSATGPPANLVEALCRTWSPDLGEHTSDGMAVSRCAGGRYAGVVFATDSRAHQLEALQETAGVGPGPTALQDRSPVLVDDLADDPRTRPWVGFTEPAQRLGVVSVYAFPLQVGATALGLLTLHASRASSVSPSELPALLRLSDLMTTALLSPELVAPLLDLPDADEQVSDLVDVGRAVIHQAVGMVSVQAGSSVEDALALLRARAVGTGTPLVEVARQVVARRTTFRDSGEQAPSQAQPEGMGERTDDGAD